MISESGKFRKKKAGFSMISNNLLRNKEISLKAKGLYSLIRSYETLENFDLYKSFLMSQCEEGRKAFDSAWKELKDAGYLVQYRMKDTKNQFYYEYELMEEPVYQNGTSDNDFPGVPFCAIRETCTTEKVYDGKGDNINNTINNNTISYPSIEDVKEQIGYDGFTGSDANTVNEIALLIHEVYQMPDNASLRINQNNVSAKTVKERFMQIEYKHIDFILIILSSYAGEVNNYRNFLLTTIFNAPTTASTYFKVRVNHDFGAPTKKARADFGETHTNL